MGMLYEWVCCIDGHVLWVGMLYERVCCIDGHVLWLGMFYGQCHHSSLIFDD